MMKNIIRDLGIIGYALMFLAYVALIIGWVMNLVALYHSHLSNFNMKMLFRIIGIFVWWLGGIMGWI